MTLRPTDSIEPETTGSSSAIVLSAHHHDGRGNCAEGKKIAGATASSPSGAAAMPVPRMSVFFRHRVRASASRAADRRAGRDGVSARPAGVAALISRSSTRSAEPRNSRPSRPRFCWSISSRASAPTVGLSDDGCGPAGRCDLRNILFASRTIGPPSSRYRPPAAVSRISNDVGQVQRAVSETSAI